MVASTFDDLRSLFAGFTSPFDIQQYLDRFPYRAEELNRSPLRIMRDQQGHCLDGGIFAAAALRHLGYPPLIVDLIPELNTDDDHVLAIYKIRGLYGSVAKSNFAGLRFREPIYRSLRELTMSYFESFYNSRKQKTLRGYTRPLNLSQFDQYNWLEDERGIEKISDRLYKLKCIPIITDEAAASLNLVDQRSYESGMHGTDPDGLFKFD